MKILIFSWRGIGHPLAGGAEIVTHEHAKAWVKRGHKVTLFTSLYKGAKEKEKIDGVEIVRKSHDYGGVHLAVWKWYRTLSDKPDLVIDQFHGIPFFTPLYVKEKKLAFIHEVAKEVWWLNDLPFPKNYLVGLIGFIFEPFVFKIFYHKIPFMTVSESARKDLIKWGIPSKNITVIQNGVSVIKTDAKKEKVKTGIFLGVLTKDKGIEDAIRIFSLINKKEGGWKFWIVGKGTRDYVSRLKKLAKRRGLGGKVKFWGYVDEKKKFELLSRAHVLINPSVREGWGLVNIEANAVGTPVVAYDVPGCRDSVSEGKSGFLCKMGDINSFSELAMVLSDNLDKFSTLSQKWASGFDWGVSTKKSTDFIESLAEKNLS